MGLDIITDRVCRKDNAIGLVRLFVCPSVVSLFTLYFEQIDL